jgi:hypothetical protein
MVISEPRAGSALLLVVPEVDELVGDIRRRYPADGVVVPPRITLLDPFVDPAAIAPAVLRPVARVVGAAPVFGFSLARVARFAADRALCLAPEPAAPFGGLISPVTFGKTSQGKRSICSSTNARSRPKNQRQAPCSSWTRRIASATTDPSANDCS